MQLPCYLINLDRSRERLRSATQSLRQEDIAFERLSAVDARDPSARLTTPVDERAVLKHMGRPMHPGEVAAHESHRNALKHFLATSQACCLVLEDDASPLPGARGRVAEAIRALVSPVNRPWSVLHCGKVKLRWATQVTSITSPQPPAHIMRANYFPMGAFALCWSRAGAEQFLDEQPTMTAPFDNQLQNWLCRSGLGFALVPAPFTTTDAASDIDGTSAGSTPIRGQAKRSGLRSLAKQRRLWKNRSWTFVGILRHLGR
jgi:glycosyl transferase family 25